MFPPLGRKLVDRSMLENNSQKVEGLTGNACTTSQVKNSSQTFMSRRHSKGSPTTSNSTCSLSSGTNTATSNELKERTKELRNSISRENQFKKRLEQLDQTLELKNKELCLKDEEYNELKNSSQKEIKDYKILYQAEEKEHSSTKSLMHDIMEQLSTANAKIIVQNAEHKNSLKDLQDLHASTLLAAMEASKIQLADKEAKLGRLKKQMADVLKGNSWERKQQLDELTKELSKIHNDYDQLKIKFKNAESFSKCINCELYKQQIEKFKKEFKF